MILTATSAFISAYFGFFLIAVGILIIVLATVYNGTKSSSSESNEFIPDGNKLSSLETNPVNYRKINHTMGFHIENLSDEELDLNLCRLDKNDARYKFRIDGNDDYDFFVEYIKKYSYKIGNTRYFGDDKKKIIRANFITPNECGSYPVLLAFMDKDTRQYQSSIVDSKVTYIFDYFNPVTFKLNPKEKASIVLIATAKICGEFSRSEIHQDIVGLNLQSVISIKNNSDEKRAVSLFDMDYYNNKMAEDSVTISNVMSEDHDYIDIIKSFDSRPLICNMIRFGVGVENIASEFLLNFDTEKIASYYSINQFQDDIVDVPLTEPTPVAQFIIEVEPHSEILVGFR